MVSAAFRSQKRMRQFIQVLSILILLTACVEEEVIVMGQGGISPEFGVPIAKATIYAEEVIEHYDEDGLVVVGENEILTLVYRDSLESVSADDYLRLDDQVFSESIEVSPIHQSILNIEGEVEFESTEIYEMDFGEDRLDSIRFEDGFFNMSFTVPVGFEVSGSADLIDPISGEAFLRIDLTDGGSPGTVSAEADLADVLIRFVSDPGSGVFNGIQIDYFLNITSNGDSPAPTEVSVDFSLTDFSIAAVGGYIAPRTVIIEEQAMPISLFQTDFEGNIILEDPRLNLFLINEYGIDVRPVLDHVSFYEDGNEIASIRENDVSEFNVVQGVSFPGDQVINELVIDNQTFIGASDLTDYLQLSPDSVSGQFELDINPEDDQSNFITRGSELNLEFEVELPIYGSISDFILVDTTDVNLNDVVESAEDLEEVEQLNLRIFVRNALPIDASLQIVFADELLEPIDSLFEQATLIVPAAPVDLSPPVGSPDYGRVIGDSQAHIDLEIPRERINQLENATKLIVYVYGNTTGNGDNPIRLYPENFIEVNLAAEALFNIDLTP